MSASVKEVLEAMGRELFVANAMDLTFEEHARAALRAAEQAGWVLVPKVATEEMVTARMTHASVHSAPRDIERDEYAVTIAAAPSVLEEK